MNYDLYFAPRRAGTDIEQEEILSYFRKRPFYLVEGNHALFNHEDTGVQFLFVYEKIVCEEEEENATEEKSTEDRSSIVSLYIKCLHPHFILREVIPEIEAFIGAFDLIVEDPHEGGMGRGDFSQDFFAREWQRLARDAYRTFLKQEVDPSRIYTYPTDALERIWMWNNNRDNYQQEVGDHIYVPVISFLATKAGAKAVAAWTDAIAAVIPKVDIVLMPRQQFAPRRLFGRKIDVVMAEWDEIEPQLTNFPLESEPIPHYILNYVKPPDTLEYFVKGKEPIREKLDVIPMGGILNAEMVNDALAANE